MPSSAVQKWLRSEEHTSELQSHDNLVCRLLLEKNNDSLACPHSPAPHTHTPAPAPRVERVYTAAGVRPCDEVEWERRDVVMTNWRDGTVNFEQRGPYFPDSSSIN